MSQLQSSKIAVIFPINQNVVHNVHKLVQGILSQSQKPDIVYFVLDRTVIDAPVIDGVDVKLVIAEPPVYIPREDRGFYAGHVRNVGTVSALSDKCDIIIFLDGDCIPQANCVESHVISCNRSIPVVSCGKRREKKYNWKDRRESEPSLVNHGFFKRDMIINDPEYMKKCLILWSCNFAMNRSAIALVMRLNEKYYGRAELFNSEFNGQWGGEDSFLGIQAWICKCFILLNKKASVEHIEHPSIEGRLVLEHQSYFDKKVDEIRRKTFIDPLDLWFFD